MKSTLKYVAAFYAIALILIALSRAFHLPPPFDNILMEIAVALMAVGLIHVLDHVTLIPQTAKSIERQSREVFKAEVKSVAEDIVASVSKQTHEATGKTVKALDSARDRLLASSEEASLILQRQVESIKVMEDSNLISIFQSRSASAERIRITISTSTSVRIMGVSLNEFVRSDHSPLRDAWHDIVAGIRAGSKTAEILLIDPYCHGAVLRSFAETSDTESVVGRLETDVLDAANYFRRIRSELGANASRLKIKLYNLVPTTFLCQVENTTFVQYYHFWSERLAGCPVPLFQYRKKGHGQRGLCMHTEMGRHFEFIWKYASMDLDEFLPTPSRGLDWGAHVSGMSAVYVDRDRPNVRMREEINSSNRIWMQGITLKTFFSDPALANALRAKIAAADERTDIRILVLDPDSEQAKQRAYREFQLSFGSAVSFTDFVKHDYGNSKLFIDWRETQLNIRRMIGDNRGAARVAVMKYASAPHMFVLIGDRRAFVEQYSYGKLPDEPSDVREDRILGSDMPLIEYAASLEPVYSAVIHDIVAKGDAESRQLRPQPFPLLESHFRYAWTLAAPFDNNTFHRVATGMQPAESAASQTA